MHILHVMLYFVLYLWRFLLLLFHDVHVSSLSLAAWRRCSKRKEIVQAGVGQVCWRRTQAAAAWRSRAGFGSRNSGRSARKLALFFLLLRRCACGRESARGTLRLVFLFWRWRWRRGLKLLFQRTAGVDPTLKLFVVLESVGLA